MPVLAGDILSAVREYNRSNPPNKVLKNPNSYRFIADGEGEWVKTPRTHCREGHILALDNIYWAKRPNNRVWAECRICRSEKKKAYSAKFKKSTPETFQQMLTRLRLCRVCVTEFREFKGLCVECEKSRQREKNKVT